MADSGLRARPLGSRWPLSIQHMHTRSRERVSLRHRQHEASEPLGVEASLPFSAKQRIDDTGCCSIEQPRYITQSKTRHQGPRRTIVAQFQFRPPSRVVSRSACTSKTSLGSSRRRLRVLVALPSPDQRRANRWRNKALGRAMFLDRVVVGASPLLVSKRRRSGVPCQGPLGPSETPRLK